MTFFLGGEGEEEEHVLQGGKAGIPEENADRIYFYFPVSIFRISTGSPQPGVGGGTITGH